ncbi:MAG: trypsin-like peptidase domain-containing protein [Phycisphaerae bacterium]
MISAPQHVAAGQTASTASRPALPSLRFGLDLTAELVPIVLDPVDVDALLAEDAAAPPSPMRVGANRPVGVASTDGRAALREVPGVGSVWSVAVVSPGAQGLRLLLSNMDLPPGAELWMYAPNAPGAAEGPHQGRGPLRTGEFWSNVFDGDEVRVEYLLPEDAADAGFFLIEEVGHIYRGLEPLAAAGDDLPGRGWCHNDVMCFPPWHPLHNATARILYTQGGWQYLCTGTLLASEAADETPYFVTARHCVSTDSVAATVTARWFYQTESCDGPGGDYSQSNNTDVLYTAGSVDMTLLMVRGALPAGLTWAGWDIENVPNGTDVACISHPAGDRKKISFGDKITHPFGDPYHYFGVRWTSGTIEGGSSGAGLYRVSNQSFIGVASHSADPLGCTNPDGPSGFGKFKRFHPYVETLLQAGSDDSFEDNDTCAGASLLGAGNYADLVVKHIDEDWYLISLLPCEELVAVMSHTNNWGDIDVELYDACGGNLLVSKTGAANNKVVSYTNDTDTAQVYYLHVFLGDGDDDTRNEYDLDVTVQAPDQLPAPTNVNASDGLACDAVLVSWSGDFFATYYTIWRSTTNDPDTADQVGLSTTTSFIDETTEDSVIYYYWVKAHNDNPCSESDFSESDSGYSYCETQPCPGDLDGDNDIDLADLSTLLANYGTTSGASYEDGDLDGDGDVDLADLSALLAVYGTTCP